MATSIDQSEFIKTALRLPPALHAAVHASAKETGRSYNAELIALLEAGLKSTSSSNLSDQSTSFMLATLQFELAHARVTAGRMRNRAASLANNIQVLLLLMSGAKWPVDEIEADLLGIAARADAAASDPEAGSLDEMLARLDDAWKIYFEAKKAQNLEALPQQLVQLLAEVDERAARLHDEKIRSDAVPHQPTLAEADVMMEKYRARPQPEVAIAHIGVETAMRVSRMLKATLPAGLHPASEIRTVLQSVVAVEGVDVTSTLEQGGADASAASHVVPVLPPDGKAKRRTRQPKS